jgi:antitoxin MazE
METTIQKWGNSKGIRIPKQILKELGLNDGSKVDVIRQGDHIEIKKIEEKKHISLAERYKAFEESHGKVAEAPNEIDYGEKKGTEVW